VSVSLLKVLTYILEKILIQTLGISFSFNFGALNLVEMPGLSRTKVWGWRRGVGGRDEKRHLYIFLCFIDSMMEQVYMFVFEAAILSMMEKQIRVGVEGGGAGGVL
jgi:hypothetical protein